MIGSQQVRNAALFAAATAMLLLSSGIAAQQRRDVGPNTNALYEKECGACHFAYQPAWLPERSWRKLMAGLREHFGENAELKVTDRDALTAYLAANAADHATSQRAIDMMRAIKPGETPIKVTQVLYVGGIHGGFLDPAFRGEPQVKTLANCAACHPRADSGSFFAVRYTISDERFRTYEMDYSASLPVPLWLRIK